MAREKIITVKCTEKEAYRIRQAASKAGMTVSTYLREIGTEGRYTRRTRDKALIGGLVQITQLCNELEDYPEIQERLQGEVDEIWRVL